MNVNKEYTFKIINDMGLEVMCDTLAVVATEDENPIIIYTDYTVDKDGKFNLFVSKLIGSTDNYTLEKIDNYQNRPEVSNAINKIIEEM